MAAETQVQTAGGGKVISLSQGGTTCLACGSLIAEERQRVNKNNRRARKGSGGL